MIEFGTCHKKERQAFKERLAGPIFINRANKLAMNFNNTEVLFAQILWEVTERC